MNAESSEPVATPQPVEEHQPAGSSPLKKLREVLGLTQEEMAQRLKTSVANVRGIEGGRRSLNKETALRAQAEFGVFAESLLGKSKEPITLLGESFSRDSYNRVLLDTGMQKLNDDDIEQFTRPLVFLLRAAAGRGNLVPLGVCYRTMLRELAEMLELSENVSDQAHRFYKRPAFKQYLVKDLRADPKLAEAVGFEDDPELPESTKWTVEGRLSRKFRTWLYTLQIFLEFGNIESSDGTRHYRDLSKDSHPYPFVPKGSYSIEPPKV